MRKLILGLGAVIALASAAASYGETIWAYDNLAEVNRGGVGDALIKFDSATPGVVTEVGRSTIAGTLMSGLDFTPDGNLWAYSQAGNIGMFSVNTTTGKATKIGSGGLTGGDFITDLSYNPRDGKMYGIGEVSADSLLRLYSISLVTGVATLEKTLSSGALSTLDVGLATDSTGKQLVHDLVNDRMFEISGTSLVPLALPEGFDANFSQGMTIDWSRANDWWHGAFNNVTFRTELWRVAPTGAGAFVGNIGGVNGGTGLPEYETGDVAVKPVPEPATLALLALGGLIASRRRRA
ncbi:MAG: hypothetical protein CHACPFDD_00777 [Phycisphaerae bacterium]|nr:hypothetical protein [Phycisphaerae bacterium]